MNTAKRELFRRTLQSLAESHAETLELLEQTFALIGNELGIDAVTFWKARTATAARPTAERLFRVDPDQLQIIFDGKACELGDTPFRLLMRLAKRPNAYVTYEDLLADVWDGDRSDSAIRSAIKRLRRTLRTQGLEELANAIDGSKPGRYRLYFKQ
jgi:DNA-binding response OmpR family regulator